MSRKWHQKPPHGQKNLTITTTTDYKKLSGFFPIRDCFLKLVFNLNLCDPMDNLNILFGTTLEAEYKAHLYHTTLRTFAENHIQMVSQAQKRKMLFLAATCCLLTYTPTLY